MATRPSLSYVQYAVTVYELPLCGLAFRGYPASRCIAEHLLVRPANVSSGRVACDSGQPSRRVLGEGAIERIRIVVIRDIAFRMGRIRIPNAGDPLIGIVPIGDRLPFRISARSEGAVSVIGIAYGAILGVGGACQVLRSQAGRQRKIVLRYRPVLLRHAVWQQFAREVAGIIHCARCPAPDCGRWFLAALPEATASTAQPYARCGGGWQIRSRVSTLHHARTLVQPALYLFSRMLDTNPAWAAISNKMSKPSQ